MTSATPIPIETARLLRAVLRPDEAARPIPGTRHHYATSHGSILSVLYGRARRLSGTPMRAGYLQTRIRLDDGTDWRPGVHRAIALAFHGPPPIDATGRVYDVHHINGDHLDNRPENLAYVGRREHAQLTARGPRGRAKLDTVAVWTARCLAYRETFAEALTDLVASHGVSKLAASRALRGRSWADVPFPGDDLDTAALALVLGVPVRDAGDLLALDPLAKSHQAA